MVFICYFARVGSYGLRVHETWELFEHAIDSADLMLTNCSN
jgi:hypothetical protein